MLGEDHCLLSDFPELKEKINDLNKHNEAFAAEADRYHQLDKEIRNLELKNSPINDEAMHELKHERAELKDSLYHRLHDT